MNSPSHRRMNERTQQDSRMRRVRESKVTKRARRVKASSSPSSSSLAIMHVWRRSMMHRRDKLVLSTIVVNQMKKRAAKWAVSRTSGLSSIKVPKMTRQGHEKRGAGGGAAAVYTLVVGVKSRRWKRAFSTFSFHFIKSMKMLSHNETDGRQTTEGHTPPHRRMDTAGGERWGQY
ncbi:hypothetical protein V3C99_016618 [Haemonchus contortus]|uniref:Uncharacterized protein n=1 Tax=Haemonchus contortus TaxID=6289 RepID=A0A7I4YYE9_HAECO